MAKNWIKIATPYPEEPEGFLASFDPVTTDMEIIPKKTLERKKGRVVLCCLNGYVGEILEVNRFKDIITITDSVESGFKAFAWELKAA